MKFLYCQYNWLFSVSKLIKVISYRPLFVEFHSWSMNKIYQLSILAEKFADKLSSLWKSNDLTVIILSLIMIYQFSIYKGECKRVLAKWQHNNLCSFQHSKMEHIFLKSIFVIFCNRLIYGMKHHRHYIVLCVLKFVVYSIV